jgi:hypothetical protein
MDLSIDIKGKNKSLSYADEVRSETSKYLGELMGGIFYILPTGWGFGIDFLKVNDSCFFRINFKENII